MGPSIKSNQVFSSRLKKSSLYGRLRYSCPVEVYRRLKNPKIVWARNEQLSFYHDLLSGFHVGDLIFDVGANVGDKSDVFTKLGATVVAVEPDEYNQRLLESRFLKYRLFPKPIRIVGKALSDKISVETMWIDTPGSALNTFSRKWVDAIKGDKERFPLDSLQFANRKEVETTTLDEMIGEYGLPFFIKIDVEGHEVRVLRGLRCAVPFLSYEVNLPEFMQEGIECLNLLRELSPDGQANFAIDSDRGFSLEQWMSPGQLSEKIRTLGTETIEVFWRSPSLLKDRLTKLPS